jgi:predicted ABC-type ATPase
MTDLTRLQSIFKEFRESTVLVEKAIAPKCAMPVKGTATSDKRFLDIYKVKPAGRATYNKAMKFDTLDAKKSLKRSGVTRQQALAEISEARQKSLAAGTTRDIHWNSKTRAYKVRRRRIHDKIVKDALKDVSVVAKGEQPTVLLTGGYPGSGKSSIMKHPAYKNVKGNYVHIDSDKVKALLAEKDGIEAVTWQAQMYHRESDAILKQIIHKAKGNRQNILYDGTMKNAKKMGKLIKKLKKAGYKVEIAFADLPLEKSMVRAVSRFLGKKGAGKGRFVDPAYVASHGKQNLATFNALKKDADVWRHWNTDVERDELAKLIKEFVRRKKK